MSFGVPLKMEYEAMMTYQHNKNLETLKRNPNNSEALQRESRFAKEFGNPNNVLVRAKQQLFNMEVQRIADILNKTPLPEDQ